MKTLLMKYGMEILSLGIPAIIRVVKKAKKRRQIEKNRVRSLRLWKFGINCVIAESEIQARSILENETENNYGAVDGTTFALKTRVYIYEEDKKRTAKYWIRKHGRGYLGTTTNK